MREAIEHLAEEAFVFRLRWPREPATDIVSGGQGCPSRNVSPRTAARLPQRGYTGIIEKRQGCAWSDAPTRARLTRQFAQRRPSGGHRQPKSARFKSTSNIRQRSHQPLPRTSNDRDAGSPPALQAWTGGGPYGERWRRSPNLTGAGRRRVLHHYSADPRAGPTRRSLREQQEWTVSAIGRARRGDPDALSHLYRQYAPGVFAYVRRMLRNDYDAQDVTQQVFVKLATSLDKYDSRRADFFAWILRMAHNAAVDHLRKHRLDAANRSGRGAA